MSELPVVDSWDFGGPLAGAPAEAGWWLLLTVAALCGVIAYLSYRRSVSRLGVLSSLFLSGLRLFTILVLLLCLANPVHVERDSAKAPELPPAQSRSLVVVFDNSESMTRKDNRGRSRLDEALATWKKLEPVARRNFAELRQYAFARELSPVAGPDQLLREGGGRDGTRLVESLLKLYQDFGDKLPAGVVVLTDGLDTEGGDFGRLREKSVSCGVPLHFIVGNNRERSEPFLRVREWRLPPVALRDTELSHKIVFEAFSIVEREVPFTILIDGRRATAGRIKLRLGAVVLPLELPYQASAPGFHEFTLLLGEGDSAVVAAKTELQVVERKRTRILVYEGALDWGYRFLIDALRSESSFELSMRVDPSMLRALRSADEKAGMLRERLPSNAAEYKAYDCVVIAHPYAEELGREAMLALQDFVRQGGNLLLIAVDATAVPGLRDSPLATLLPVTLSGESFLANSRSKKAGKTGLSGVFNSLIDGASDNNVSAQQVREPLTPFSLTEAGQVSPLFSLAGKDGALIPRFRECLGVSALKPAAQVLAEYPSQRLADGRALPILVQQSFGRGRCVYLGTDLLWRWKLTQPSNTHAVEAFWQQFFLALGRRAEVEPLRFVEAPIQVSANQRQHLSLEGGNPQEEPVVSARAPGGDPRRVPVRRSAGRPDAWELDWTPDKPGMHELLASQAELGGRAHLFPLVSKTTEGEGAKRPPALEELRSLAADTGGQLLLNEPPATWAPERSLTQPAPVSVERRHSLWSIPLLLGLALGTFALELILRRFWRLT